jgi:hypothetical protein
MDAGLVGEDAGFCAKTSLHRYLTPAPGTGQAS